MGRTRMGRTDRLTDARTDRRTDGQGDDYMLPQNFSGSIKTVSKMSMFETTIQFNSEQPFLQNSLYFK